MFIQSGLKYLFSVLMLVFFFNTQAQTFAIPIGSSSQDEGGASLINHPSGDVIIGGFSNDSALVTRVNSTGNVLWAKTYKFGVNLDRITEIKLTSTGHIIGSGIGVDPSNFSNYYSFAFKLDINGTPLWMRHFKYGVRLTVCTDIIESSNGNYRCAGAAHNTTNHSNGYIIEFDQNTGATVWDTMHIVNTVNNVWDESYTSISRSPIDGAEYIPARFQTAGGQLSYRPTITKIDNTGNHIWTKIYNYTIGSSGGRLYGTGIEVDGDSIVMVIHGKNGGTGAPWDCGIIKIDESGNSNWVKWYTSTAGIDIRMYDIISIPTGYLLAGRSLNLGQDLLVIKTDKQGNLIWSRSYGTPGIEDFEYSNAHSRIFVEGSEIVMTGKSDGFGSSDDIVLYRIDLVTGNLNSMGCSNPITIVESSLPNYTEDYPTISIPAGLTNTNIPPAATTINFGYTGNLVEHYTDTLVGGDTLYICSGDTATVRADWNTGLTYAWNTGNNGQTEIITSTGMYSVVVSGGGCQIWSDSVYVVVDSVQVDLGSDLVFCNSPSPTTLTPTTNGTTFLWQDGSGNPTFTTSSSGLYWVQASLNGCSSTDSITIDYITVPPIDLGSDTALCAGLTLALDATTPGVSYNWQDGSSLPTFNANTAGTYWVETSINGCTQSDTLVLSYIQNPTPNLGNDTTVCDANATVFLDAFEAGATYLWQDGSTNSDYTVSSAGIYWVQSSISGCTTTDSITINFIAAPTVDLGTDSTLCTGGSVFLDATTPGATYVWQDGSTNADYTVTSSGTYWVEVSNSGCSTIDSIDVTFVPVPTIDLGSDTSLCALGGNWILDATTAGCTYVWQDGTTDAVYAVSTSGSYWVQVDNGFCTNADTILIDMNAYPSVDLGADTLVCIATPLILDATCPGCVYTWQDGSTSSNLDVTSSGTYWVEVDLSGCTASDTINIEAVDAPSLLIDDRVLCFDESLPINVGHPWATYLWQDGSTDSVFTIEQEGIYSVIVSNPCGVDTADFKIGYKNCLCEVFIPNAFTPDGTMLNNTFGAVTDCDFYSFELLIYNRWGEPVFTSSDPNVFWDATYNGQAVQDGIYTWKITYAFVDAEGEIFQKTGHVSVIR